MNYIMELLPIVPAAILATTVLYFVLYKVAGRKRVKPTRERIFGEFVLTGWFVVFIYVTQIKSFGNGMGELYNLRPLHPFYIALRYGSNNADMVWQFFLNMLMFFPLGFLLPIVFPEKCGTWPRVLSASFCVTLSTEFLQLISRRGTDIDDMIANTAGGLCGFAIFVIIFGIVCSIKMENSRLPYYRRKLTIAIALLCVTATPFLVIRFMDNMSKFGNMYYGHLQPCDVQIGNFVSNEATIGKVYKYTENVALSDVEDALISATGFDGDFVLDGDTWVLADGENRRIFVFPYNKWCVYYDYGEEDKVNDGLVPNEDEALRLAWEYLKAFDISSVSVRYTGTNNEIWSDGNQHLKFESTESSDGQVVYGNVSIIIGERGELMNIEDRRIWCNYFKNVDCISPKESVSIARDVGVGGWNGTAYVSSIESGYYFIEDTGYLIPVWNISAKFIAASGDEYDWSPVIDAIK